MFKHIKGGSRFIYGGVVLCPELRRKENLEANMQKSDKIQLNSEIAAKLIKTKPWSGNNLKYAPPKEPPPPTTTDQQRAQ